MKISLKIKPLLLTLIKLFITFLIFKIIAQKVNVADILSRPVARPEFLISSSILAVVIVFFQGVRWFFLCRYIGFQLGWLEMIRSVWAGHFLNNTLPTSAIGDVLRSYSLRSRGATTGEWVRSLIIEKYFSLLTALTLAVLCVLIFDFTHIPLMIREIVVVVFVVALMAPVLMLIFGQLLVRFFSDRFSSFLPNLGATLLRSLTQGSGVAALAASLLVNALICIVFYGVAQALELNLSLIDCCFVVPVFTILAGLPISYGGWGVREMTSIHVLRYYGASPEIVLSATIFFGLIIFASSLPGVLALPAFRKALRAPI